MMGLVVLRSSLVTVTHSVFTDSAYHALLVHGDTTEVVKMNDASINNKIFILCKDDIDLLLEKTHSHMFVDVDNGHSK